jgi:hypothetical protein
MKSYRKSKMQSVHIKRLPHVDTSWRFLAECGLAAIAFSKDANAATAPSLSHIQLILQRQSRPAAGGTQNNDPG